MGVQVEGRTILCEVGVRPEWRVLTDVELGGVQVGLKELRHLVLIVQAVAK